MEHSFQICPPISMMKSNLMLYWIMSWSDNGAELSSLKICRHHFSTFLLSIDDIIFFTWHCKINFTFFLNFKNARVLVYAEFMMLFLQNSLKPEVYENGTQFLLNLKKIVKSLQTEDFIGPSSLQCFLHSFRYAWRLSKYSRNSYKVRRKSKPFH